MNNKNSAPDKKKVARGMVTGSLWMISMNWGVRVIGLINTVIIARFLFPEDLGLFAMGAIMLGLITAFTDPGVEMLVIREKNANHDDFNVAWTITFIQRCAIGIVLLIVAPIAAAYFGDERVTDVVRIFAVVAFISAFRNIGVVLLQKEMLFSKLFKFHIYNRLGRFVIAVPMIVVLESYWALVINAVIGMIIEVALSYYMHSYRPRFSLQKWRYYLAFSMNMLGTKVAQFCNRKADVFIVGGLSSAATVGIYNMGSQLSKMLTSELIGPINNALLPGFAKIKEDADGLHQSYITGLAVIAVTLIPIGFGVIALANDIVTVILGEKWMDAIPIIKWLVVMCVGRSIIDSVTTNILIVKGYEKVNLKLNWVRTIIFITAISIAAFVWGVSAIPPVAAGTTWLLIFYNINVVSKTIGIKRWYYIQVFWKPLLSGLFMWVMLSTVPIMDMPVVISMVLKVLLGVFLYIAAFAVLWKLFGEPSEPEKIVWQYARKRIVSITRINKLP